MRGLDGCEECRTVRLSARFRERIGVEQGLVQIGTSAAIQVAPELGQFNQHASVERDGRNPIASGKQDATCPGGGIVVPGTARGGRKANSFLR